MKIYIHTIIFIFAYITAVYILFSSSFAHAEDLRYTEIDLPYTAQEPPLKLSIWYPAQECASDSEARLCLADSVKSKQTAILSHGAMGSARELNWLGYALASQGIIAVGVNHLGESWVYGEDQVDIRNVLKIWQRPEQISFALNAMQANRVDNQPLFDRAIEWDNVTAIGFSSGGSTALAMAGARYNPQQALEYCAAPKSQGDLSCRYLHEGAGPTGSLPMPPAKASQAFTDTRVKRVIALDPPLGT